MKTGKLETIKARQAFEDYWDMGPGRSLAKLASLYRGRRVTAGEVRVPTTRVETLEQWSREFNWQGRLFARMRQEAELAEMRAVQELQAQKKARLAEAQALRAAGVMGVRRFLELVRAGELEKLPFAGYKVFPEKGPAYRVLGLTDLLPTCIVAIECGQRLERIETGEDVDGSFLALVEAMIAEFAPEEQQYVRRIARRIASEQS